MLAVDTSVARIDFMTNVFKLAVTIPDKVLEDHWKNKRSNLEIAKGFVAPFPSNAETWGSVFAGWNNLAMLCTYSVQQALKVLAGTGTFSIKISSLLSGVKAKHVVHGIL